MSDSNKELKFIVRGGRRGFAVTFYIGARFLNAECDCPAGVYGTFCQHRLKLLRGDGSEIVSDNENQLEEVVKNLPGTRLDAALNQFEIMASRVTELRINDPSTELDQAEFDFKAIRKKLSAAMMQ